MRKFYSFFTIVFCLYSFSGFAQTNPAIQNLPLNINFGAANYTPPFTNMAAWAGNGGTISTQAAAEASVPAGDATVLTAGAPTATGGQYGDGTAGNGRLTIVTSSNATNGATQTALAINTTSATGITISYDLSLQVVNPRIVGVVLQYRIGTTGAFTTIAGSPVSYTSGSSNGGDADGTTDWDNYSFPLPATAENQPEVQIRWAVWRGGSGNSSGIGIDNISISTASTPVCTTPSAQPTILNLTAISATQIDGSFTAAVPPADGYLVVRSTSSTLSSLPATGITYIPGQALGGGFVVSFGSGTSFSDIGLAANTLFYYFVFAVNNENCTGGPVFQTSIAALQNNISTLALSNCIAPLAPPTGIALTPGVTAISVSFTASATATKYLAVIHNINSLSAGPINTIVYSPGQSLGGGTVKYYGNATNFVITGLSSGTNYFIFVFAVVDGCTGEPVYNASSLNGNSTTLSGTGIPPGYYSTITGLTCTPLKTALYNIIRPTSANPPPTYDGICTIYPTTDYRKSDDLLRDIIWDMYSNNPTGPDPYEFEYGIDVDGCGGAPNNPPIAGTLEGRMYNREHSFPRSWFGGSIEPMNSDIMHIYPTDKEVNNRRASFPFGETSSPTWTSLNGSKLGPSSFSGYSGTVFEPIAAYKGDFARSTFYMATAYENDIAGWQPNADFILNGTAYQAFDNWHLQLLFKWHTQDPVSQKEIDRNNAVYVLQGNRNPFIDHPELVYDIWSCTGAISLPIQLYNFTVSNNGGFALLDWKADRANGFSHFEMERSSNGVQFENRGRVELQTGSINYQFTESISALEGNIYYRIKMVDANGDYLYSAIRSIRKIKEKSLEIYPNPAQQYVQYEINNGRILQVMLYNIFGKLEVQTTDHSGNRLNIQHLPSGKYILKVITSAGISVAPFIKL